VLLRVQDRGCKAAQLTHCARTGQCQLHLDQAFLAGRVDAWDGVNHLSGREITLQRPLTVTASSAKPVQRHIGGTKTVQGRVENKRAALLVHFIQLISLWATSRTSTWPDMLALPPSLVQPLLTRPLWLHSTPHGMPFPSKMDAICWRSGRQVFSA